MVRFVCKTVWNRLLSSTSSPTMTALKHLLRSLVNYSKRISILDADETRARDLEIEYEQAFRYRRGEMYVLQYWQNLVKSALMKFEEKRNRKHDDGDTTARQHGKSGTYYHASSDKSEKRDSDLRVGSSAYINYLN